MALYKAYGKQLVDNRTVAELVASGQIAEFEQRSRRDSGGMAGLATPFTPIGINKPLTIEIRHVYTGEYPKGIFGGSKGMLVTSAIRSNATFNAAPRAVNFLRDKVPRGTNLENPAATEQGTPLIFYAPALTERNTLLTIEIIFDEFPQKAFDSLGSAFSSAAGIPLFAAASTYLVAAGMVSNLLGRIGERLFDGRKAFTATAELSFLRPGDNVPQQGFHLLAEEDFDLEAEGCTFDQVKGELLVERKPYAGPHPYVVFSLDGQANDSYASFIPTAASAALLEQFYHINESQESSLGTLIEAVKLYNDWEFRKKADALKAKLAALPDPSPQREQFQTEYDACVANILNDALRP